MMSLWDALRMNMMISYQELVRTFPKHPVTHPLNSLFNVIKFPAQFLYFVVIREQDQATFRDLHGNARADLKSRFSQPFGADFDHQCVTAVGKMLC